MGRFLSLSSEQMRRIDDSAMPLPSYIRARYKYGVLIELEHRHGRVAVSNSDIDCVVDHVMTHEMPTALAPGIALGMISKDAVQKVLRTHEKRRLS